MTEELRIITVPAPILREKVPPVTEFNAELRELAGAMIELMNKAEGVGLAANQVNQRLQIFVYGLREPFEWKGRKVSAIPAQAVVNPTVTVLEESEETMDEGCLSIPGLSGPVARPVSVRLGGFDLTGMPLSKTVHGYEARIIQHEVDHLNGILFLDHITDPSKIVVEAPDE